MQTDAEVHQQRWRKGMVIIHPRGARFGSCGSTGVNTWV